MTSATRSLILRAIDQALVMSVINLYEVVNADTSDEGIDRFERGLRKTVDLHDQLVNTLKEPYDATRTPRPDRTEDEPVED
jgi:hypothetical protein